MRRAVSAGEDPFIIIEPGLGALPPCLHTSRGTSRKGKHRLDVNGGVHSILIFAPVSDSWDPLQLLKLEGWLGWVPPLSSPDPRASPLVLWPSTQGARTLITDTHQLPFKLASSIAPGFSVPSNNVSLIDINSFHFFFFLFHATGAMHRDQITMSAFPSPSAVILIMSHHRPTYHTYIVPKVTLCQRSSDSFDDT